VIAPVVKKVRTPLVVEETKAYSSVTGSLAVATTFPVYVVSSSTDIELLDDRVIANGAGGALPPPPPPPQETTKNITINILSIFMNKLYIIQIKRGLKSPLLLLKYMFKI
jgi:hypothetical protein|tara:strand:- start:1507 stop:1836 length:330 start_codon:yes stop_codon:yes gene_type:complete